MERALFAAILAVVFAGPVLAPPAPSAPLPSSQEPAASAGPPADAWAPFRFFVGTRHGQGEGSPGRTFVFVSEAIENIPAGFKTRLTCRIVDPDTFEQTFDLAPPGQELKCCSKGILKRQKGVLP